MVSIDYVTGPHMLSLWKNKDNGQQILFLGEAHNKRHGAFPDGALEAHLDSVSRGGGTNPHIMSYVPAERYIKNKLEASPDLRVYAEIPSSYVSANQNAISSLGRLQHLKTQSGLPSDITDRIENIDYRNDIHRHMERGMSNLSGREPTLPEVRNYIRDNFQLEYPSSRLHKQLGIQKVLQYPFDGNPQTPPRIWNEMHLNPYMDDEMVKKIEENPDKDLIFLTGSKHTRNVIDDYLTREGARQYENQYTIDNYEREAGIPADLTNPLPITRF